MLCCLVRLAAAQVALHRMVAVGGSRLGQGLADAPNPWPELELQDMYGKVGARPKHWLSTERLNKP